MESQGELSRLSSADQEAVGEMSSLFLLCKNRDDFRSAMGQLQKYLSFEYWSVALCQMEGEFQPTSKFVNIVNFPEEFMEAYMAQAAEFFDVIVVHNFKEVDFGELQWWEDTMKHTEENPDILPPEMYEMHRHWQDFLDEWGILRSGFSLGERSHFAAEDKWYGSIVNYGDKIENTERNRTFIKAVIQAQHVGILSMFRQELLDKE